MPLEPAWKHCMGDSNGTGCKSKWKNLAPHPGKPQSKQGLLPLGFSLKLGFFFLNWVELHGRELSVCVLQKDAAGFVSKRLRIEERVREELVSGGVSSVSKPGSSKHALDVRIM